ncbi:site-specific tyrosine recombinase XerD [Streptococcus equinus]|uniref:site-specific tyrosine recombinase XerD n=1 Tax=Streptococcus equinus TaxID=1335 RepID=UPI001959AAF3|nr:site-specific tyrosine recombinase XerD [Streptococcus equinus]
MIDFIQEFIDSKSLSENSKNAYFYDLQQFVEAVDGKVSKEKLALYEHSLAHLKTSAKKRKISAVNQFLYFLYDTDRLDRFYKLSNKEKLASKPVNKELLDYSAFYQESPYQVGQLIALLMIELGLSSSDLQGLKVTDLDKTFAVLRVQKAGLVRVLEVPEKLLDYMTANLSEEQIYLFDNQGKSYSRQWFFNQLKAFLATLGLEDLSAQDMRRQYVLHQKAAGKSLLEVSRNLGLKSPVTLEKFYN